MQKINVNIYGFRNISLFIFHFSLFKITLIPKLLVSIFLWGGLLTVFSSLRWSSQQAAIYWISIDCKTRSLFHFLYRPHLTTSYKPRWSQISSFVNLFLSLASYCSYCRFVLIKYLNAEPCQISGADLASQKIAAQKSNLSSLSNQKYTSWKIFAYIVE